MNDTDQYFTLEPKRVPDVGPAEAHMYHLPRWQWVMAQRDAETGRWAVVVYLHGPHRPAMIATDLGEGEAKFLAHAERLLRLVELGATS